jgi:predicted transcriptional regulator
MKRTNIALDEDQYRLLNRVALAQGCSRTKLIRQAVDQFLAVDHRDSGPASGDRWSRRLNQLLVRVRERTQGLSSNEIEADVTAASREVRRRRSHPARSHRHQRLGLGAP